MIDRLLARKTRLIGVSIARILVGAGGVHYYVSNYPHRGFLLGPRSYLEHAPFGQSLFDISQSTVVFEVLYHSGLAAALVFAVFGGRFLAFTHAALFWSVYARNPNLFDGGDTFGRIATIFLIAAVSNAHFAPGAPRRRRRLASTDPYGSWTTILHNAAVVMLVLQIVGVYFVAGLSKLIGVGWRHGVALFQISQLADYGFVELTRIASNPMVGAVLTYAILAFEVSFAALVWTKLRTWCVAALAAMHAGIAVAMGLVGFGIHMCAGLAVCLGDDDYRRLALRMRRSATRVLDCPADAKSEHCDVQPEHRPDDGGTSERSVPVPRRLAPVSLRMP